MIEPWTASDIWRVLVEECGARDTPDDHYSFIVYLTEEARWGHEYRFQGALGFGGKFYNSGDKWCVSYYLEHETRTRAKMARQANKRLAALRAEYLSGD